MIKKDIVNRLKIILTIFIAPIYFVLSFISLGLIASLMVVAFFALDVPAIPVLFIIWILTGKFSFPIFCKPFLSMLDITVPFIFNKWGDLMWWGMGILVKYQEHKHR